MIIKKLYKKFYLLIIYRNTNFYTMISNFSKINNFIAREIKYSANTYKSLNVVINKAKGVHVWDTSNKMYLDFLSGYSAVNQGHCHPKIVKAAKDQLDLVTITSRSF